MAHAILKIILLGGLLLLVVPFESQSSAQSTRFTITTPTPALNPNGRTVPTSFYVYVFVNVTSPNPLVNVTLYFKALPFLASPPDPSDFNVFNKTVMTLWRQEGSNYTFATQLGGFQNQTTVWGEARAFDTKSNVVTSGFWDMYSVLTIPRKATLDLGVTILDVDPKSLSITPQVSGYITNSISYSGAAVTDSTGPGWIPLDQQQSEDQWQGRGTFVFSYPQGYSQLFPFDSYTYNLDLSVTQILNYSEVTLNRISLPMNQTVPAHLSFSPTNASQISDDSAWNMTSTVRLVTSGKYAPEFEITVNLTRQTQQTEYYIIIPALALYAFLGVSVFLTRENEDLTNRLFIYLSIFLFVYAFLSVIKSLSITPFYTGFSVADLLGIALVPCTVIMAFASVTRWRINSEAGRTWADIGGSFAALIAFSLMVQIQLPSYNATKYQWTYQPHYFVLTWPFGPLFAFFLLIGPIWIGLSWLRAKAGHPQS